MSAQRAVGAPKRRPVSFTGSALGVKGVLHWPPGPELVVATVAMSLGAAIVGAPALIAVLAPGALGVLVLVWVARALSAPDEDGDVQRLVAWTLGSFVLHIVVGVAIHRIGDISSFTGPDAGYYHDTARDLVDHWTRDFPHPVLPSGKEGFFYLLAAVYWLFGPTLEAGLVLNAVMAAALVPVLSDLTRRLIDSSAARHVPPLAVLTPGLLVWTSQLLREAGVLLLIAVAANCAVRITHRATAGPILALAWSLALLFTFRGNVALIMVGGVVVGLVIGKRQLLSGLSLSLSALSLLLLLVVGLGLGYSGYRFAVGADLQQVETVRSSLSQTGASGFASQADVSTPGRALSYLPFGFANFFLGPFPWQIQSTRQLVALPDLLVWWYLLASLWRGLWSAKRRVGLRTMTLLVPVLMTGAALSLLIGNFGTVLRERTQVAVLLFPFIAEGLALRRDNDEETPGEHPEATAPTRASPRSPDNGDRTSAVAGHSQQLPTI